MNHSFDPSMDFMKTLDSFDESAEFALDKLLDSEIVKPILDADIIRDLPIVNIVNVLYKIGITFRDKRFINNLLKLLQGYSKISLKDRVNFSMKYFVDDDDKKYFSEKLLFVLENIDFSNKVDFITLIMQKRIYEKIRPLLHSLITNKFYHLKFDFIKQRTVS